LIAGRTAKYFVQFRVFDCADAQFSHTCGFCARSCAAALGHRPRQNHQGVNRD
jgi:hypothetical protein